MYESKFKFSYLKYRFKWFETFFILIKIDHCEFQKKWKITKNNNNMPKIIIILFASQILVIF
jgi:hypothetical protein